MDGDHMKKHFRFLFSCLFVSLSISGWWVAASPVAAQVQGDAPVILHKPGKTSTEKSLYQSLLPLVLNQADPASTPLPSLGAFTQSVTDGQSEMVKGVYVDEILALWVVQQPAGDPYYVSSLENETTQYDMAKQFGVTGLIAHNDLAGGKFFDLLIGETIRIIYGDGRLHNYKVTEVSRFQALEPASFTSSFLNLDSGEILTAAQLFARYYMGGDHVTFQTCISQENVPNWGRTFIFAMPASQ